MRIKTRIVTPLVATAAALGIAGLVLAIAPASADVITWTNDGSGTGWDTSDNWDPAEVPDPSVDDVVFPTGGPWAVSFANNFNLDPADGRTVTLDSDVTFQGSIYEITFNDDDQLHGSGALQPAMTGSKWGSKTYITAAQLNFSGAINLIAGGRRETYLEASATDAMGSGPASGSGYTRFDYTWGAQSNVDGLTAGITVSDHSVIGLNTTVDDPSTLRERFTVNDGGILRGNETQLGYVTRVTGFSAAPTGAEAVLAEEAVIVNTDHTAASLANLGTDADLLYGLSGTLNDAGFELNVGSGTPWKGLSTDGNTGFASSTQTPRENFYQGTIVIDDGGGSLSELLLSAPGADYSYNPAKFYLGDGGDAPAFVSASGSGKVALRTQMGDFFIDSQNLDLSGISGWIFEDGTSLTLSGGALPGDSGDFETLLALTLEGDAEFGLGGHDSYVSALMISGDEYGPGLYDETDSDYLFGDGSITVVPEPASLALMGLGSLMMLGGRKRRQA